MTTLTLEQEVNEQEVNEAEANEEETSAHTSHTPRAAHTNRGMSALAKRAVCDAFTKAPPA